MSDVGAGEIIQWAGCLPAEPGFLFCLGATHSDAQELLLHLHSGIAPRMPKGPCGMPGMQPRLATYKTARINK